MGVGDDEGLIAKTKQAAIAALMSSGIQAEERWWNEAEFSIHRRQSGRIEQTKFIVRAMPNATLKELFVQMDSDLGCEVTCDVRTIKEYQLENCCIFEPPPFCLSRIVRDEWTAWHKLWRNLGASEDQIKCLILLDVDERIHEEAEEIEVWSPSYPRSLQTVWTGNNEQSAGQIWIHYSNAVILSSSHRAPWTRARMWTIQGHDAFENAQGHGGRLCAPLPQAMSIKNKRLLRLGVPSLQDLQKWAEQSQSSEDYKQLMLETFESAPQWLAERRVNVKWKPLSVSSDMEHKSSICLRVRQISASPAVAPLSDVPNRQTQSIMYVPLQVNRFQKSILLIVQYKYLKSCSGDSNSSESDPPHKIMRYWFYYSI